jgi:glycerate 2-kinase
MKFLVAPDKFKGSLSATEAAHAISEGLMHVFPDAEIHQMPIADGGEGTMETMLTAVNGDWIELAAHDPLGRTIHAHYAWLPNNSAVIEMSEASGLRRLSPNERNPIVTSTFGAGEMIDDAARRSADRIIVGLGGSATNDGGAGMAAALGYQLLTSDGEPLVPVPKNLLALERIKAPENLNLPDLIAACDVTNPLLGKNGASRTYGPQKGATPEMVEVLEQSLEHLADICAQDLGCDYRDTPGAGAAGGLGFGLLTFCGAKIISGFDIVADTIELEEAIADCDVVITGEGKLDEQTLSGKAPASLARLAQRHSKPVLAIAGAMDEQLDFAKLYVAIFTLVNESTSEQMALAEAAALVRSRAEEARVWIARELKNSKTHQK